MSWFPLSISITEAKKEVGAPAHASLMSFSGVEVRLIKFD